MKNALFLLFFALLPALACSQSTSPFPNNFNKARLGYATSGAGLIHTTDSLPDYTPVDRNAPVLHMDSTAGILYFWKGGVWNATAGADGNGMFSVGNNGDTVRINIAVVPNGAGFALRDVTSDVVFAINDNSVTATAGDASMQAVKSLGYLLLQGDSLVFQINGSTGLPGQVIIATGDGGAFWGDPTGATLANNGVSMSGDTVQLGDILTKNTEIDTDGKTFRIRDDGSYPDLLINSTYGIISSDVNTYLDIGSVAGRARIVAATTAQLTSAANTDVSATDTVTISGQRIRLNAADTRIQQVPNSNTLNRLMAIDSLTGRLYYIDKSSIAGGGGGSGTVTSITAGVGLTGGAITTSGTIAADTSGMLVTKGFLGNQGYLNNVPINIDVTATNVNVQTTSPGYSNRDGAEAFYTFSGDTLIQIGGWPEPNTDNQQWYSLNDGLTWTQADTAEWSGRHTFGFVKKENKYILVGSDFITDPSSQDEVWVSYDGLNWTQKTAAAEFGLRTLQGTVLRNDTIFLMGGQLGTCSIVAYKDVWFSVNDGANWTQLCASCLPELGGHIWRNLAVYDGYFWIVGGEFYDSCAGRVRHKKVYRSADGINWTLMSTLPIDTGADTGLSYSRTFVWNDRLWMYAGVYVDGSATQTRYLLSTADGVTWNDLTNASLPATHAATVAVKDGNNFVVTSGWLFNDVYLVTARRKIEKLDDAGDIVSTDYLIPNDDFFGTSGQTLRHNGTKYIANSFLYNDGTKIGINTTSPTQMLTVATGDAEIYGVRVGRGNAANQYNTALGFQALNAITSSSENTGLGWGALKVTTSGSRNTAVGTAALFANTSGINNTAVGVSALETSTGANNNTAFGRRALWKNSSGTQNTAIGAEAAQATTTGSNNLAAGYFSLFTNTSGSQNTAIGVEALYFNTTAAQNTAVGYRALYKNTTAAANSAFGTQALLENTTGANNSAFGFNSLNQNTTGADNTGVGNSTLALNSTGLKNTAIGVGALGVNTSGVSNVAIGFNSGTNITTSSNNTMIGVNSGAGLTTGASNTFIGTSTTGPGITTGSNNTIIGGNVTGLSTTTSNNIVIADGAGNQRINVIADGKTGLGIAAPLQRLHVAGKIQADTLTDTGASIAGFTGTSGTGVLTRLALGSGLSLTSGTLSATGGAGTVTSVGITAPAAGITVSGSPVTSSGSMTLALADDLAAVEGLSASGIATRTASNTWAARTIVAGAGMAVTNGDGVAGNPSLSLEFSEGYLSVAGGGTTVTAATPERIDADSPGTATSSILGTEFSVSGSTIDWTGADDSMMKISGTVSFSISDNTDMKVSIYKEGVELAVTEVRVTMVAGDYHTVHLPEIHTAADDNDTFAVYVEPISGTTTTTVHKSHISIKKLY